MMAMVAPSKPTIAFVYGDEAHVRRNRLREKLTARGFVIKKEYVTSSRSFDFSTVDLVVVLIEGVHGVSAPLQSAAERAGVPVIPINHQVSRAGWDKLDAYVSPVATLVPSPAAAPSNDLDPETAELFALVEAERDEERAKVQKLTGELGNVRADRDRLTKEVETLRGRVARLETQLEEAKLGSGELQEQREAWRARLSALETEKSAAIAQNAKLLGELVAAREAIDRHEHTENDVLALRAELETALRERSDYATKYKMAAAREAQVRAKTETSAVRTLRGELEATTTELRSAQAELEILRQRLATRQGNSSGKDLGAIAKALRAAQEVGAMTAEEALDRIVEATK